jgi:GntR family transcriptional regulator
MSRPIHVSIHDDLRVRISAGEWRAGERLPSEADLAARYGVARMTMRQALGALAAAGMVIRRQGLGTFVAEQIPGHAASGLMSFTEEMRRRGLDVRTTLIKASVAEPPRAASQALRLGDRPVAIQVRRLRSVPNGPVVVQNSWLPFARFAGLAGDPLLNGSLYARLETCYGVRLVRATQAVTAAAADDQDASLLGLRPGDPVLWTVRTAYDGANVAVEYATSARRPGYPIETVMEREPTASRHRSHA